MRRGMGAAGLIKRREREERMAEVGNQIDEDRTAKAKEMMETFKSKLSLFAEKYRKRIQADPEFRDQFVSMCEMVGVDPVRSNKSVWADVLLGVGTFYTDLSVQVVTIAMNSRKVYGPLVPLSVVMSRIQTSSKFSIKDIHRAVKSLKCFGGMSIVKIGIEEFLCSLPDSYGADTTPLIETCFGNAFACQGLTVDQLQDKLGWPQARTLHAIQILVKECVLWIDEHKGVKTFWVLSQFIK